MKQTGLLSRMAMTLGLRTKAAANPVEKLFKDFAFPYRNITGLPLSSSEALGVMAVWAALRVIADGVAQVPWKLFRKTPEGRVEADDHPLQDLLSARPSDLQTSFQLRETIIFHAALTGDAVCFLNRVGNDREIREIIPISPSNRRMEFRNGKRVWYFRDDQRAWRIVPNELIWQISGPSWDAASGLNVLGLAQSAFGLSVATEKNHADFFRNGAKISGTYSVDSALSAEEHAMLTDWIKEAFSSDNAHNVIVLDRGAKFNPLQMSGVDSQHIETRKHQVEEIARAFRVFPIMMQQSDKAATYASAEQMFIAHVVHTLSPWYSRIEASANSTLLTREERATGLYTKFLPNGLMRGAARDRAEFYSRALGAGGSPAWMVANEVREAEDMNRKEGGDTLFFPPSADAGATPDSQG